VARPDADAGHGTQSDFATRPFPSLDGEWECLCDYYKTGKLVSLTMEIEGSDGKCFVDDNVAFRLSGIVLFRERRWMMVTCQWCCRWAHAVEEGTSTWRFRGAGDFVEGTVRIVPCNCLEGTWTQVGHTGGPWTWNCRRRGTRWWYERPPPAARKGGRGADGPPVPEWQHARREILERVRADAAVLERAPEAQRCDPDVVLAAVAYHPEALAFASAELLLDRDFLFEAVQCNAAALAFIPPALRGDCGLVLAAVRNNSTGASAAAPREVRRALAAWGAEGGAEAAARLLPAYEGEALRLVGPCNAWQTSDAHLRLRRCQAAEEVAGAQTVAAAPPGSGAEGGVRDAVVSGGRCTARFAGVGELVHSAPVCDLSLGPQGAATRHELTICLLSGRLSFQIVSCTRVYSFKVFPVKVDESGMARLVRGDPRAVLAAVGGEKHGRDKAFCIEEEPGATVQIFVEVLDNFAAMLGTTVSLAGRGAAGTFRGVAVWYTAVQGGRHAARLEEPAVPPSELPPSTEPQAGDQLPYSGKPPRTSPWEVVLLADADSPEGLQALCDHALSLEHASRPLLAEAVRELLQQVPVLSSEDVAMEAEPLEWGYKRTALLVDAGGSAVLGYCLWVDGDSEDDDGFMRILHLAVLEAFRGEGLGRVLVRWAVARVAARGGRGVRLQSVDTAVSFYEAFGFKVRRALVARVRGVPMELRLPRPLREL